MKLKQLGRLYQLALKEHPVTVQSFQTGLLMGSGDLIAQTIVEKKTFKEILPRRTAMFFMIGTCLVGPSAATWYKFLAKNIGETGRTTALKKVAADQLFFAPSLTAVLLSTVNILQGNDFEQIKKEMNAKFVDIMLTSYTFWPAVQLVNFYFLPLNYQLLLVQVVALFWNAYLSWKTQQKIN